MMLLQLLQQHPEALFTIVKRTPMWVWGLLAGLMALGLSQLRNYNASLVRVSIVPVGMTAFSVWGMVSAFSHSMWFVTAIEVWVGVAAVVALAVGAGQSAARYDRATRTYAIPGSAASLLMITGIFMTKYIVGVEMAMQPGHLQDAGFVLAVSAIYGVFNGLFAGRAIRLWKLALPVRAAIAAA